MAVRVRALESRPHTRAEGRALFCVIAGPPHPNPRKAPSVQIGGTGSFLGGGCRRAEGTGLRSLDLRWLWADGGLGQELSGDPCGHHSGRLWPPCVRSPQGSVRLSASWSAARSLDGVPVFESGRPESTVQPSPVLPRLEAESVGSLSRPCGGVSGQKGPLQTTPSLPRRLAFPAVRVQLAPFPFLSTRAPPSGHSQRQTGLAQGERGTVPPSRPRA